jgi:hypothetical protein
MLATSSHGSPLLRTLKIKRHTQSDPLGSGLCEGWLLPCENCGALVRAPTPTQHLTMPHHPCGDLDEECCWCGKCGFPNVLSPQARGQFGLDTVPLWPVTPARAVWLSRHLCAAEYSLMWSPCVCVGARGVFLQCL